MNKTVLFGKEARAKLLAGVNKITEAVSVTMGASGKCVLIGQAVYGNGELIPIETIVTKDGYTVTKHFNLSDLPENRGVIMIKEAAQKTVDQAGDATTCTCVLANEIVTSGMAIVDMGSNSQEVKKGIDKAVEDAVAELKKISILVGNDNEKIFNIATVSANNDTTIGRMIADAFKTIGNEGIIDIEEGKSTTTEIKISDGYKFDRGWVSPLFINNKEKQLCEFIDPIILFYDKRITHHTQVERAVQMSNDANVPLLIICEDADEQGLAFLAMNNLQQRCRVCVVKAPSFGDERRKEMEDMAMLTGGEYISDLRGVGIKEIRKEHFGIANKVIVSKDETIIIGGNADKKEVTDFLNELRMNLAQAKNEDERFPIEKRIAKINGGVAVIQVGATTETELREKLDRFDDAVRATKAAIAEGYVAGGGTAFIRVAEKVVVDPSASKSFQQGQNIIKNALRKPLFQMATNAGKDGQVIFDKVSAGDQNFGYNTRADKFEDLVEAGIIDSTKALRCALMNAASISGMLLTSECLIETGY